MKSIIDNSDDDDVTAATVSLHSLSHFIYNRVYRTVKDDVDLGRIEYKNVLKIVSNEYAYLILYSKNLVNVEFKERMSPEFQLYIPYELFHNTLDVCAVHNVFAIMYENNGVVSVYIFGSIPNKVMISSRIDHCVQIACMDEYIIILTDGGLPKIVTIDEDTNEIHVSTYINQSILFMFPSRKAICMAYLKKIPEITIEERVERTRRGDMKVNRDLLCVQRIESKATRSNISQPTQKGFKRDVGITYTKTLMS